MSSLDMYDKELSIQEMIDAADKYFHHDPNIIRNLNGLRKINAQLHEDVTEEFRKDFIANTKYYTRDGSIVAPTNEVIKEAEEYLRKSGRPVVESTLKEVVKAHLVDGFKFDIEEKNGSSLNDMRNAYHAKEDENRVLHDKAIEVSQREDDGQDR